MLKNTTELNGTIRRDEPHETTDGGESSARPQATEASALETAQAGRISAEIIAEALTVSEIRYRRLFESTRNGILILDSETGRITDANPFMADLLGYSHDEFLGKELWEIGLLGDKASSQEAFQHLQQDGHIRYEGLPLETRRGERREVEFVSNLYRENGYTFIQCNIGDITDRKAVERDLAATAARNVRIAEALTLSEVRFRRLFEAARDGILLLDSETGKITDANPFMAELLGYAHEELLGKELWEIGLLQDKETSQKAFRQLLRDDHIRYENLPLENRRGKRLEVEFVSSLHRESGLTVIQCNIRDITDRKAVEQDLAAVAARNVRIAEALTLSEVRFRRLFETARDGILLLDSETGKITDANPFMTELLGYAHEEFLGKELWEIGLLQDKAASQEAFQHLQQDDHIRYDDLPLVNRRGERREVEFVSNLYREGGHAVIQCNVRDITERRIVEQTLAVAAARNERIAETLQRSMLQESPEGAFPGLTVETLYVAALRESDLGGDFFDTFSLSGGKVALVVGDVSGKGLVAAARTAEVKYALRAFLHEYHAPDVALSHLNDFICETHRQDHDSQEMFIVLALAVVDTESGETALSAAGAEPTLILRRDGVAEPIEIVGTPLGIRADAVYLSETVRLQSGETVLMATDGITEARRGRAFLGTEGLQALAEKFGPTCSLPDLRQAIYGGARDFAGGALRDDVCLLLARRQ